MRRGPFLALALVVAGAASPASAQPPPPAASTGAFLNITPKRITFDRAHRNGVVFLLNQGAAPVTVDIALVDRVMLPDGQIAPVDDANRADEVKGVAAGLKSARDLLQVSPRRVTLQPGRPQTVRVRLSTLPDAAAGEHRSHLTVMTLPPPDTGVTAESAASGASSSELRFRITAVYGLSIPLIVRPTDPQVAATLEGARVEYADTPGDGRNPARRTAVVAFDVVRGGASSVYGNFEVRVVGGAKGAEPLGMARGVGVYPEIARRVVRIPLSRAPAPGERLEVTFTDDDTSPGKVLAKAAL
jgi:P pilus assembly chaperone PapD